MNFESRTERPLWKRMPVTVEVDGKKENIWVEYIVEMKPMIGNCTECGLENVTMPCESVKEVKIESKSEEAVSQATEKIIELVKRHEQKMFVCSDCLNENFYKKRKDLYIKALEEAQAELGIEVDKDVQRKNILEN